MLRYPDIDPIAVQIGPLAVHWYGLMYLLAFVGVWAMLRWRIEQGRVPAPVTAEQLSDWVYYAALGVILGGRLGYCIFYQPRLFLDFEPLVVGGLRVPMWGVLRIWEGGMSFHGGLLGVMVASAWLARRIGRRFLELMDFLAPAAPFGLLCGRIGNFINGELWGRPTDLPWAMVFPHVDAQPRHPSMLYEAALEGVLLWALLWWYSARPRPRGAVSAWFLIGYGAARFAVEFVREPDRHIGYLAFGWLTMGHLLSLPMLLAGAALLAWVRRAARSRPA